LRDETLKGADSHKTEMQAAETRGVKQQKQRLFERV